MAKGKGEAPLVALHRHWTKSGAKPKPAEYQTWLPKSGVLRHEPNNPGSANYTVEAALAAAVGGDSGWWAWTVDELQARLDTIGAWDVEVLSPMYGGRHLVWSFGCYHEAKRRGDGAGATLAMWLLRQLLAHCALFAIPTRPAPYPKAKGPQQMPSGPHVFGPGARAAVAKLKNPADSLEAHEGGPGLSATYALLMGLPHVYRIGKYLGVSELGYEIVSRLVKAHSAPGLGAETAEELTRDLRMQVVGMHYAVWRRPDGTIVVVGWTERTHRHHNAGLVVTYYNSHTNRRLSVPASGLTTVEHVEGSRLVVSDGRAIALPEGLPALHWRWDLSGRRDMLVTSTETPDHPPGWPPAPPGPPPPAGQHATEAQAHLLRHAAEGWIANGQPSLADIIASLSAWASGGVT